MAALRLALYSKVSPLGFKERASPSEQVACWPRFYVPKDVNKICLGIPSSDPSEGIRTS